MNCRHCGNESFIPFADLQNCPPSNSMLTVAALAEPEVYYPLVVEVCDHCFLAQVGEHKKAAEIFSADYTYFSSYSSSWLDHCRRFADKATAKLGLGPSSKVIEVASNDGYLLQFFAAKDIAVLGVEPTANTAQVAIDKNIPTIVDFFGRTFAREQLVGAGHLADLIVGNNVYAHVPDINDFTAGLKTALGAKGVVSLEFPHLLELILHSQFDTIYHEHFSYLSLGVVEAIFAAQGLKVFDVERLTTHGGSLRVWGAHEGDDSKPRSGRVSEVLSAEEAAGLRDRAVYEKFQPRIDRVRADFLAFLLDQRRAGRSVAAYGAAAKGNTLLNYSGIKGDDLIEYVVDLSPHKQGKFLPGSHLPVLSPEALEDRRPDVVVILPWNLKDEILGQLQPRLDPATRFVVAVPELTTL